MDDDEAKVCNCNEKRAASQGETSHTAVSAGDVSR